MSRRNSIAAGRGSRAPETVSGQPTAISRRSDLAAGVCGGKPRRWRSGNLDLAPARSKVQRDRRMSLCRFRSAVVVEAEDAEPDRLAAIAGGVRLPDDL